jgi:hypothetical protein
MRSALILSLLALAGPAVGEPLPDPAPQTWFRTTQEWCAHFPTDVANCAGVPLSPPPPPAWAPWRFVLSDLRCPVSAYAACFATDPFPLHLRFGSKVECETALPLYKADIDLGGAAADIICGQEP